MNGTDVAISAADAAYARVKEQILDGELAGGTMVSEGAVADALGMSRTPVREAFLRLQAEGWMRLYPKRGALVREVAPHELDDVVGARILLETGAVRRISSDATRCADVVGTLTRIIEDQRAASEADDIALIAEADARFHATIVAAGGNTLLSDFFATLRDRQRRMVTRSLWRRADRTEQVIADHEMLVRLIAERTPDAFELVLSRHILDTHRELLA